MTTTSTAPTTADWRRWRQLLLHLTAREFRIRYQSAFLGWLWAVGPPLVRLVVLGFVFTVVFRNDDPDYVADLAVGLLAWSWFAASVSSVTRSAVDRRELLSQPGVSRQVLPVVVLLTDLADYLAALPVLLGVVLVVTGDLSATALLLPLLLVVQGLLALGLGMAASVADVRFRDVRLGVDLLLSIGFYATPVFFTLARVPGEVRQVLALNPMTQLIEAQRRILVDGVLPDARPLLLTGLVCAVVGALGWFVHRRAAGDLLDAL